MPLNRAWAVERLRVGVAKLHTARMLGWDDLRYFLAFARVGSMQAAAKALGVNQSTVQRRLAELEERVGQRLSGTLAAIGSPSLVGNYAPPPKP